MTNTRRGKIGKEKNANNEAIPIETKTLEDFKCGYCGLPLLIHVFWNGGKYERIVECKNCKIRFPLEENRKSKEPQGNKNSNNAKPEAENSNDNKKESLVERLVKSW